MVKRFYDFWYNPKILKNFESFIQNYVKQELTSPTLLFIQGASSSGKSTLIKSIVKLASTSTSVTIPTVDCIDQVSHCINTDTNINVLLQQYYYYDFIVFEDYDYVAGKDSSCDIFWKEIIIPLLYSSKRVIIASSKIFLPKIEKKDYGQLQFLHLPNPDFYVKNEVLSPLAKKLNLTLDNDLFDEIVSDFYLHQYDGMLKQIQLTSSLD